MFSIELSSNLSVDNSNNIQIDPVRNMCTQYNYRLVDRILPGTEIHQLLDDETNEHRRFKLRAERADHNDIALLIDMKHNNCPNELLVFHVQDKIDIHIEYFCIEYDCVVDMYNTDKLMYTKDHFRNRFDNHDFRKNDMSIDDYRLDSNFEVIELIFHSKIFIDHKYENDR